MGSFKISNRKVVIIIVVAIALFSFFIKGIVTGSAVPTRDNMLKTYPFFEALNKVAPEQADNFYEDFVSALHGGDEETQNKLILKLLASINTWFDSNIGRLLNSASDDVVNEYGRHFINSFNVLLKNDPTGVQCFNTVYPGVIGDLDIFKLKDDIKGLGYKRTYLNSIADSIARRDKIDRLPVEQIEEAFSIINNKLVEKYGEDYYIEDPKELAKQPSLVCRKTLDLLREVVALDPHLSAEILRYINAPE
ncbi:hypothetical protein L7G72_16875 [Xenorhabdus bovienii]|uniref:hypothetical protein n=1 Tax=Xenorhabdus bovienii TaxID=40576 RepID=UPI001EE11325|nr:hypothetical protein [Xenorhabdus bovienii]MCG3463475.1 hypothetical protein [Xenorhabdus bovienii]